MVARVTALWASLVGKRGGKATNHCINATGSLSLLLQIGRKADVHVPTRDQTDSPVQAPEVPQSMSALERKAQVTASTPQEVSGPGTDGRGIPRNPWRLKWRLAFPEATRSGHRGPRQNSSGTSRN